MTSLDPGRPLTSKPSTVVSSAAAQQSSAGAAIATRLDGSDFELTGKAAAVIALASLHPQISKRRVALLLWPDSPETQARNNLRTLVHRLNKQLGAEVIGGTDQLTVDARFVRITPTRADELLAAFATGKEHRWALLAGVGLEHLEEFQSWLGDARHRVRQLQLRSLEQALASALSVADAASAIAIAKGCVTLELLSERWHRQLIRTLITFDDKAAALEAYEVCKAVLRDRLGATPDEQTRSLYQRALLDAGTPVRESERLVLAPRAASTPLVERSTQLRSLEVAFSRAQHIVLQGEAGVGKTSLLSRFAEGKAVERMTVHRGAQSEPYAALAQLLREVQRRRSLPVAGPDRIEFARIAPSAFPDARPSIAALSIGRLRSALAQWAQLLVEAGVRLLAIDDLHYADAESQAALATLIGAPPDGLDALPIALCYRTGEAHAAVSDAVLAAQLDKRVEVVMLQRLSQPGVESLLRLVGYGADLLGSGKVAEEFMNATGGNPLFVVELAVSALDRIDTRFGSLGNDLGALLRSRLSSCSDTAKQLAHVAAISLEHFSVDLASAVSGLSPLSLMPAWTELQQRGIFDDDGLTHDLMRDAVLGAAPAATKQVIHRQVALYLESLGVVGAPALRHWRAAGDADGGFRHAVHEYQEVGAMRYATLRADLEMLGALEELGDSLAEHLWITAGLDLLSIPETAFAPLARLIERAEALPRTPRTSSWIAFERARTLYGRDRKPKEAYALLSAAAESMPATGSERAWVEVYLNIYCFPAGAFTNLHARRSVDALAGQVLDAGGRRLAREVLQLRSQRLLEYAGCVREEASLLRAAKANGDAGAAHLARTNIAAFLWGAGMGSMAARHFRISRTGLDAADEAEWHTNVAVLFAQSSICAGRYQDAIECMKRVVHGYYALTLRPFLAHTWLLLGRADLAREALEGIAAHDLAHAPQAIAMHANVCSRLQRAGGLDGAEPLRAGLEQLRNFGNLATMCGILEIQIAALTGSPQDRLDVTTRVLGLVRPPNPAPGSVAGVLLMQAEAYAELGDPRCREAALEGAWRARRHRTHLREYPPELFVRFSVVLRPTEPDTADALLHIGRRWLLDAMRFLPPEAAESFTAANAVNQTLLCF